MLAVVLIYMVLAAQFESLVHPFTVMLSLPLSIVGALGLLALTGRTLNIFSMIGMIMLMGLVTKNAILLIDYTNLLRSRGMARERGSLAGRSGSIAADSDDGDVDHRRNDSGRDWAGVRGRNAGPNGNVHRRRHGDFDRAYLGGHSRRLQPDGRSGTWRSSTDVWRCRRGDTGSRDRRTADSGRPPTVDPTRDLCGNTCPCRHGAIGYGRLRQKLSENSTRIEKISNRPIIISQTKSVFVRGLKNV